jgi:proline iminopeptidase
MTSRSRAQVERHDHDLLDVGDGHQLHWEAWGAPSGKPAVVLHGGPGSGCARSSLELFDLDAYRVILFDQRGCGRSLPHAARDVRALTANTTQHLVADIERLRAHVGVERWLVLGGSWGSTLALAYAETHPRAVSELILFSVVTTSRREVEWVTRDVGRFFPQEWQRLRDGVAPADRDGNLAKAYSRLLLDPDPAVHRKAALEWCAWEDRHVRTGPQDDPDPRFQDAAFRLCFARLVTHYWSHDAWLAEGALLRDASRLQEIPGVLVHGRLDVSSPPDVPWQLARAWRRGELVISDGEGHRGGAHMADALAAAMHRYQQRA